MRFAMDDILIIDDSVSKAHQGRLIGMVENDEFAYFYESSSVSALRYQEGETGQTVIDVNGDVYTIEDTPHFTHLMWFESHANSPWLPLVIPIITALPDPVDSLIRIKVNRLFGLKNASSDVVNVPHIDTTKHPGFVTAIYYVNDSDGDTFIYNERYIEGEAPPDTFTVKQRVTPKQGRLVVFDGSLYHSASTPRDNDTRVVININVMPYKKNV